MNLDDVSWEECQEYLARDDRVILPIGATEAHGRHLGLGTDYVFAEAIARATGERTGVMVAPALAYGMSLDHMKFPGTLSLTPATLTFVLQDLFRSLYRHGFRRVLVVNGHGGNNAALLSAVQVVSDELDGLRVKSVEWWTEPAISKMVDEAAGTQRGTHSSTHETSFLMAVKPDAVQMERAAKRDAPVEPSREIAGAQGFAQRYPDAVMGLDPSMATPELGQRIFQKAIAICMQELENW